MDLELGKLPWLIWVSSVHCFEADDPCEVEAEKRDHEKR